MPGRTRRRIGFSLTIEQRTFLIDGDGVHSNPFAGLTVANTFGDMAKAKEAWQRHRDQFMTGSRGLPGRPWGWWAFDSPAWRHLEPKPPARLKLMPADPNRVTPRDEVAILKALGLPERTP